MSTKFILLNEKFLILIQSSSFLIHNSSFLMKVRHLCSQDRYHRQHSPDSSRSVCLVRANNLSGNVTDSGGLDDNVCYLHATIISMTKISNIALRPTFVTICATAPDFSERSLIRRSISARSSSMSSSPIDGLSSKAPVRKSLPRSVAKQSQNGRETVDG